MKKIVFTLLLTIGLVQVGSAQIEFNHSVGGAYLLNQAKGFVGSTVEAVYYPRINFVETDGGMTVSAGIPVGFGINVSGSSRTGVSRSILFDFPAMVDVNFGHGSSQSNLDGGVGGFAGAGFRYLFERSNGFSTSIYGPNIHGGVRFSSFSVFASYARNLNNGGSNLIGVGFMYNFNF